MPSRHYAISTRIIKDVYKRQDWDKALEWFGKGAEKEESRCRTELGLAYENGNGVEENPQKAVEYMMKAAEQDYGYAQLDVYKRQE